MACNFINVGGSSKNCKENFSGVGSTIYIFTKDDLDAKGLTPAYSDIAAEFLPESFAGLTVHKIAVKAKSGKVTATSNPNAGGFSNVYTGVVANDMATMSAVARIMNNRNDWGVMVPAGQGKYYVLYDPDFDIEFSMESDTGDAPDSDHGHTVTITQSPMVYALPTWAPEVGGELDVAEDGGNISTEEVGKSTLVISHTNMSTSNGVTATINGQPLTDESSSTTGLNTYKVDINSRVAVSVTPASSTNKYIVWSDGLVQESKSGAAVVRTITVDSNGAAYTVTAQSTEPEK